MTVSAVIPDYNQRCTSSVRGTPLPHRSADGSQDRNKSTPSGEDFPRKRNSNVLGGWLSISELAPIRVMCVGYIHTS